MNKQKQLSHCQLLWNVNESALKETSSLANSLLEKVQALFSEAAAETEEAFYAAYNIHQEAFRLKGQLEDVDAQLASHGPLELPDGVMDDELRIKWMIIAQHYRRLARG